MRKAFFIDVQGTLISDHDKRPINGACEFIYALNEKNIPYVIITNNSKKNSKDFLQSLKDMGLDIKNYIDPFFILKEEVKVKRLAAFGTKEFLEVLLSLGYILDYENPEALVVSIKKDYTNEDYALMIECAFKTNNLVAMHDTSTYAKDNKRYPGVGSIMKMICNCVNKEYTVVGKPSYNFYNKAKNLIEVDFKDITVISDDMLGDLLGAKILGMKTSLVLSGKIKDKNEIIHTLKDEEKPDYICEDMSEVLKLFNKDEI